MSDFITLEIKLLADQQIRFAPVPRRLEQLGRAQKLLGELSEGRSYPYDFVCYRLTDYRPRDSSDLMIPGEDLRHDLPLLIRQLHKSIPPVPVEQIVERTMTLEEVAERFEVSTKTIGRWRMRGLIGYRVLERGRGRLAFPISSVEQFAKAEGEQLAKAARFRHMTESEKRAIFEQAKILAGAGANLMETSRTIAKNLSRSVEAVRYTLRDYDERHAETAFFPEMSPQLDAADRAFILDSYDKGNAVETLAKIHNRSRNNIHRVINQARAERLVAQPLDYMPNAEFDEKGKAAEIMAPMPHSEEFLAERLSMKAPRDVPAELASLYEWPLLTREQERHVFRKMNYLKHRIHQVRSEINPQAVKASDLEKLDELHKQVQEAKELLINCNMRLVASIAKKHAGQSEGLFDLISDGNVSLLRAVEKFDYSLGNKFSTYATWAIVKNFARSIPDEKKHKERYVTGNEEVFDGKADQRGDEQEMIVKAQMAKDRVRNLLDTLDPRTRDVIRMRNGLDGAAEMTLEQIGQHFGITKERVRQINVRGMKMLREKAFADRVELP